MKTTIGTALGIIVLGTSVSFSPAFAGPPIDVCDNLGLSGLTISSEDCPGDKKPAQSQGGADRGTCDDFGLSGLTISKETGCLITDVPEVYLDFLLGASLPGTVTFTSPDDLNGGLHGGVDAGIRLTQPWGFFGAQVGVSMDKREFTSFPNDFISTNSLMFSGVVGEQITNMVDIYGGFGLGGIQLVEQYPTGGSGIGLGYQAIAGAEYKFSKTFSLIGEVRYQNTFEPIKASNGFDVQAGSASADIGLRISFPVAAPPPP